MSRQSRDERVNTATAFSWRRVLAVVWKEIMHIIRDPQALFQVTLQPAVMLITLAYMFTLDVERFPLAVLDQDRTALSREYLAALTSDGTFQLLYRPESLDEAHDLLVEGRVRAVIIIPPGFMDDLQARRPVAVQALIDGTNPNVGGQALTHLSTRTQAFGTRHLSGAWGALSSSPPIDIRTQVRYNPTLKALYSMVPGLIAVVMNTPSFAIATSLTREREMGTLEGLVVTPLRNSEFLIGKFLPYAASGLLSAVLTAAVAVFWFQVPFRGPFLLFLLLSLVFLLSSLWLSLLIANFLRSQQSASVAVFLVFFLPSFFLAGLLRPIDRTSLTAQIEALLIPTTHYIAINRGLFLKGVGLPELWRPALTLFAIGTTALVLTIASFKRKLT
ncbi:MAG: ABC transporter permease [Anaerolineae bacterium]|nr:ABC transporter permease [Anaerolineae bacterium]